MPVLCAIKNGKEIRHSYNEKDFWTKERVKPSELELISNYTFLGIGNLMGDILGPAEKMDIDYIRVTFKDSNKEKSIVIPGSKEIITYKSTALVEGYKRK